MAIMINGALADEIDALHRDIRARNEPVRWADFRCDTASSWMRRVSTGLHDAAGHVGRIAAAMKPGTCAVRWGGCPEHGNTERFRILGRALRSSG